MTCHLCQTVTGLCESHIVPEFFYRTMYDEKHRFFTVSSHPKKKNLTHQKGVREKLLCPSCEGRFAKNEKYFSELFFGGVMAGYVDDGRILHMSDLDYPKLKLMFLSVLWRMSVTSMAFFDSVTLGPHEEKIRAMLLSDDPGLAEEYGVMAIVPFFDGKKLGNFITKPDVARVSANRVYRVVLGGVLFSFYVPGRRLPQKVLPYLPSPDGRWRWRKERIENIKFLFGYTLEVGRGIHSRKR